ncbi:protein FAM83B [Ascaphus truei]|uniref:protein FAM83B n=1 Tax=Ascaphus truei TaxID=8439 RepID=UPI003F590EF9
MESLSLLSSLHDEGKPENGIDPHYKEWYRVAIDALIEGGIASYQEFLAKERATEFLAEDELNYITNHIHKPSENTDNSHGNSSDDASSSGTYWPMESDVEAPNLDLGWPYVAPGQAGATDISLYFHPPRGHPLTIKEMIRKMIKEARQVIAIVMDMFTDVDILKELVEASTRGVPVYLLLDDINFPNFLKITDKQGIQVQRLRNMRVRTVKGQDYSSKSGAKFCGKMEQKFLLVDCEKVMYGTYSFMWSYEKIHLSMVQVLTGKLVESFDEEFRTLYARSCIPTAFGPEESSTGKNKKIPLENGTYQSSMPSLVSASSQRSLFGRKDQIHTLDSSYLKTRNRFATNEDEKYGMRSLTYRPHNQIGFNVQNKINHFQQFERNDNWKRHSYAAGEKPESSPYLLLNRAANNRTNNAPINWNRQPDVASIGSSSRGGYSCNYNGSTESFATRLSQRRVPNLSEKHSSVRRSFHGTDSHVRSIQQRMPTLEHTTKSFLRNWRIESYLNDHSDIPPDSHGSIGDRYEVHNGTENIIENPMYTQSRLRSSLVYKPILSEQKEAKSYTTNSSHSNSTIVDSQGSLTPKGSSPQNMMYSGSKDGNHFTHYDTKHLSPHDALKRHSLQIPEGPRAGLNYNTNKGPSSYLYTTLCTNRQSDSVRKQQNENILKRRSLPLFEHRKVNVDQSINIPPNYIYNSLVRKQAETPRLHQDTSHLNNTQNLESSLQNVDEHVNSKSEDCVVTNNLSGEYLAGAKQEDHSKEWPAKKESKGSPSFLKKGSKKLKSLLSLTPEKKETLSKNKAPAFYRMCSSSDTLISEDDDQQNPQKSDSKNDASPRREKTTLSTSQNSLNKSKENVSHSPIKSLKSVSDEDSKLSSSPALSIIENKFLENTGDASAPRFNTEQIQYQDAKAVTQNIPYGRAQSSVIQQIHLRPQTEILHREMSQREKQHTEMPPMLQREMQLRHSQHREMQQKELQHRDMHMQPIHQDDSNRSRLGERRVYSRFEPFCKLQNTIPSTSSVQNNNTTQISDFKSNTLGRNYTRPNHSMSYNSSVYSTMQPNENKFGRFMQKFGNFIHKKQ